MAVRLTEARIERLKCPPGSKDQMVFDSEQRGLGVRVVAAGTTSYVAQYTLHGMRRRIPLGSTKKINLDAARKAAAKIMGEVALGHDPAQSNKAAKAKARDAATREAMTLSKLVSTWSDKHLVDKRPRYRSEATKAIQRAFSEWWSRPAEELTHKRVLGVLDSLPPSMARATTAYGRACFAWAAGREGVPAENPFAVIRNAPVVKRERVLDDAELNAIWVAAGKMDAPFGPIVQLLILTGQRREEVGGMAWNEVSKDLSVWVIPGQRAKNGVASIVPLSTPARALIKAQAQLSGKEGLVLPGQGGRPFGGWSKMKAALDKASGVTDWRLHDLRRTVATGLQRLGVRLEVTEAVLNHTSGSRAGIVGIYQRHDWRVEKEAALSAWADHVLSFTRDNAGSTKVVTLASRARRRSA